MMTGRRTAISWLVWAALLLAVAFIAACGRKGPPVPLRQTSPAQVTDLRYEIHDDAVTLLWSYPRTTVQGEPLTRIDRFEILRAEVAEKDFCAGCPLHYDSLVTIDGGPVGQAGHTGRYEITDPRPGYRYFFKVRAVTGWHRIGKDSNVVSLQWPGK